MLQHGSLVPAEILVEGLSFIVSRNLDRPAALAANKAGHFIISDHFVPYPSTQHGNFNTDLTGLAFLQKAIK